MIRAAARRPDRVGTGVPLTPAQQRIWFLHQLDPDSPAYNLTTVLEIDGRLNLAALRRALTVLGRRHHALSVVFRAPPGEVPELAVVQDVASAEPAITMIDLVGLPAERRAAAVDRTVSAGAARPRDLAHGPLAEWRVLRLAPDRHVLVLDSHHIVLDGASLDIVCTDLADDYRTQVGGRPAAPVPVDAFPAAVERSRSTSGPRFDADVAYWRAELAGYVPVPVVLPEYRQRGPGPAGPGGIVVGRCRLAGDELADVRRLGAGAGATVHMTLVTAVAILLARYGGHEELVIGTTASQRDLLDAEDVVGLLINLLPVRVPVGAGRRPFEQVLTAVRRACLDAYDHRSIPFERLVDELRIDEEPTLTPLFTALLAHRHRAAAPDLEGAHARVRPVPGVAPKYPVTVWVTEGPAELELELEADGALWSQDEVDAAARHLRTLLVAAARRPDTPTGRLSLVDGHERRALGPGWPSVQQTAHDTGRRRHPPVAAHRAFERCARSAPDAIALVDGDHSITYRELNTRANRLARTLRAAGAGPEVVVAVCLRRAHDLPTALLAVLKAGAAYLPLDPDHPEGRRRGMIADAGARILVTESAAPDGAAGPDGPTEIVLDRIRAETAAEPRGDLDGEGTTTHPGAAAYVLFTSGSTGRPKGITVTHGGLGAFLRWIRRTYDAAELRRVAWTTSACFDIAAFELFGPLTTGGTVVLTENVLAVADLPAGRSVTLLNTVPSAVDALLAADALPPSAATLNVSGEAFRHELALELATRAPHATVRNLYGPTEATVFATSARLDAPCPLPPTIGAALPTATVWGADDVGHPVPVGVVGGIVIGGGGLARGYVGSPGLTAERFVPDPVGGRPGARIYLTGDRARTSADGDLGYLGRADAQVKLRGVRIELAEIELALRAHPAVRDAAVVLVDDDSPAGRRLVGFVDVRESGTGSEADLLGHLRARLPDVLVPAELRPVPALPLTTSGKIDRPALVVAVGRSPHRRSVHGRVPPRTELERKLAAAWCATLGTAEVGVHDRFFDVGGNSLLLLRLHDRLQDLSDGRLRLMDLFRLTTIAAVAEFLDTPEYAAETAAVAGDAASARGARRRRAMVGAARRTTRHLDEPQVRS